MDGFALQTPAAFPPKLCLPGDAVVPGSKCSSFNWVLLPKLIPHLHFELNREDIITLSRFTAHRPKVKQDPP